MKIPLETIIKQISGVGEETPSIFDGTVMNVEEAEQVLSQWGLGLNDLTLTPRVSISSYLSDTDNYDVGLRKLSVQMQGGNRVLTAEVAVQYKRIPRALELNLLGRTLKEFGFLESIPNETRDFPFYFSASALIDRPIDSSDTQREQEYSSP